MHDPAPLSVPKPTRLFDRDAEWKGLVSFASGTRAGTTLGVVSGRRRQGTSYLLQALAGAMSGIYFPALEVTEAVALRVFTDELIRFTGTIVVRLAAEDVAARPSPCWPCRSPRATGKALEHG